MPFGFKNLEGQAALGLHISLETRSNCYLQVIESAPFAEAVVERRVITLRAGRVDRRGSVRILLSTSCTEPPTVREWWWLDGGGERLGTKRRSRTTNSSVPISSLYEQGPALQIVTFVTAEGRLELFLPPQLSAGETLSGSLAFEVAGEERERSRNLGTLRGYSLELGGEDLRMLEDSWTRTLSADLQGIVGVTLWDITGELVAANAVELGEAAESSAVYRIPRFTQGGEAFAIQGPFDGDLSTTEVSLGDGKAKLLAESLRVAVLRAPSRPVGTVEIRIVEGEVTALGELRNVEIQVVSPRRTIETGERLDLRVEIDGLEGLDRPLSIELFNNTLALAHFADGSLKPTLTLTPEEVPDGGRVSLSVQLEGSQGGLFEVEARLASGG